MKAKIDRSGCIGCGLCVGMCPEIFHMADDGLAEVIMDDVPGELESPAAEARDSCPAGVISVD